MNRTLPAVLLLVLAGCGQQAAPRASEPTRTPNPPATPNTAATAGVQLTATVRAIQTSLAIKPQATATPVPPTPRPAPTTTPVPATATPTTRGASASANPLEQFRQLFDAGASCAELWAIRRSVAPSPQRPEIRAAMDELLDRVNCSSDTSERKPATTNDGNFTVAEYRIYRAVVDLPYSVAPEGQAEASVARSVGKSRDEVKAIVDKVMLELFANDCMGRSPTEIRHATDWKGEKE